MTDFTPFHRVIKERATNPNAWYYADPWWDEEIKQFIFDMNISIRFIQTECTDEELYWLGEIFDDIMDKTRSTSFINAIRERAKRVVNPKWRAEIEEDIHTASEYLDNEGYA